MKARTPIRRKSRKTRVGKTGRIRLGPQDMSSLRWRVFLRANGDCELSGEISLWQLCGELMEKDGWIPASDRRKPDSHRMVLLAARTSYAASHGVIYGWWDSFKGEWMYNSSGGASLVRFTTGNHSDPVTHWMLVPAAPLPPEGEVMSQHEAPPGFWEYLERNAAEVAKWPGWMKGMPSEPTPAKMSAREWLLNNIVEQVGLGMGLDDAARWLDSFGDPKGIWQARLEAYAAYREGR